jgi:hypothetical protein
MGWLEGETKWSIASNTLVMDADGNEVRACVKGTQSLVMGADGNEVKACVKLVMGADGKKVSRLVKARANRRWVTGSETGALPVKGEHIQVQWTGDGKYKGKWFGAVAVVLMHDVRALVAREEKRPKYKTTFRKHLIQYTGDDQEEEWVLLEWSERPFFTKKKNPGQSEAALDLLNTVPWKRAGAK